MKAFDDFFTSLPKPRSYRYKQLTVRFVRSVNKRTPSAYAATDYAAIVKKCGRRS